MKLTLEQRIVFFAFIILFLTILANSGMDISAFRKDYVKALVLRSQSLGRSMKGSVEKVLGLGLELKDLTDIPEKCRDLVRENPEIAYCTISDLNGNTLFSNDPPYKPARFAISFKNLDNNNSVNLIGDNETFYDTSTPIISPEGKPIAYAHVGFREKIVSEKVTNMAVRSFFILVMSLLIAISLVVIFVKKAIINPISVLLGGVKNISEGSFDTHIESISVSEFNTLAETINFMSDSLKIRDDEIQKNYRELENTHLDLHDSYQKLERLSLELEKSEEFYKSLMEDSSDAIVVINSLEQILMLNRMAEDIFGYSAHEIIGLPLTKLLLLLNAGESIPKMHRIFSDALTENHIVEEMRFVNKKGATVLGRVNVSRMRISGEQMVQVIVQDITREDEILKNLEQSAANLAKLNKMKDSFLGLASHELKTPLTVIMGYASLITAEMTYRIDPTVLEMVKNISNAALRLDNIVKDMVDVSMIDEKKLQLKRDSINLNRLVEDSVNELRFFFSMRKQELVINLDPTLPDIRGDQLRLMQLLSNILGNAIKFTPDGGTITIATSVKYLLRSRQNDSSEQDQPLVEIGRDHHMYIEVSVSDTGIGIDRDDQLRIFEKFYEVGNIEEHSSGKVAFQAKGAGLGLTIAKGIVEMHGGEIWVESRGYDSELLPGSTFHILLPLDPLMGDATLDYMNLIK
jgi:PAS domain S-box-containing protein